MQIQILNGVFSDPSPDFRTSYPINMRPEVQANGISEGYLRTNDGVEQTGTGPGFTRGGIEWREVCYRVMGSKLVAVAEDGTTSVLGDVGGGGTVSMTYGFDRIAVTSNGGLFYWDGSTFTKVTDPDLGQALDVTWIDGYFITTDGENIVVTELGDPTSVDPLKYGSSEVDPDPVVGVLRLRSELYAINTHTIETFQNVGGSGFPFQPIRGAQIHKGAVGTHAAVVYQNAIAFLGGGRNESPAIWIGANGGASKLSTKEVDELLGEYTEAELSQSVLEVQTEKDTSILFVHLPNVTLCFDGGASEVLGRKIWYALAGDTDLSGGYPVRHFVWAYNRWLVGDPNSNRIGEIDRNVASVWGDIVTWRFGTPIVYNESKGAIFHELELVGLTGTVDVGAEASVYTEYSLDGLTWSQQRFIGSGDAGDRRKRLRWFRNGKMTNWRIQRFGGNSKAPISVARLEARIEGLAW